MLAAVITSQTIGLVGTLLLLAASAEAAPPPEALVWAAAAGISGVGGLGFFYLALSRGTMGLVAPLAALIGAGLPVLVAIAGGETVPPERLGGIGLALVAVVLISLPGGESGAEIRARRIDVSELPFVVLAGLGFAGFFLGMDRASAGGETWFPLVVVRIAGLSLVGFVFVAMLMRRRGGGPWLTRAGDLLGVDRLRASGIGLASVVGLFTLTGVGDLGGNAFFLLAKHADTFAVAVVLSSLYPVVTTLVAAVVLHERLRRLQLLGVGLATISVPLLR